MNYSNKRRREINNSPPPQLSWLPSSSSETESHLDKALATLYVEAHEADIIHGKQNFALMLEPPDTGSDSLRKGEKGSALVKWRCDDGSGDDTWVDRYDARLLLTSSPASQRETSVSRTGRSAVIDPPSPSGWSDLPSDAEDMFFFSPRETEEFRRAKRRRVLDDAQETRLRALRERGGSGDEGDSTAQEEDIWGGSDEEPDPQQLELMSRTASHILTSPNPVQLEARILTNHGADKRFSFLKGRWKKRWVEIKHGVENGKKTTAAKDPEPMAGGLAGLGTYGDSDDDTSDCEQVDSAITPSEEDLKAARRARAREWAAKRRARGDNQGQSQARIA